MGPRLDRQDLALMRRKSVAMPYGSGARLDMESPLLRGQAPERRPGCNRSAQRKRPTVRAVTRRAGRFFDGELTQCRRELSAWRAQAGKSYAVARLVLAGNWPT